MLLLIKNEHSQEELNNLTDKIKSLGLRPHLIPGQNELAIGITGNRGPIDPDHFSSFKIVLECIPVTRPYKHSGREFKKEDTLIHVGDVTIGGDHFVPIGGPCAVESYEQTLRIAKAVKNAGAKILRGGAYKPRTSPYSFQGLGIEGLKILEQVKKEVGLPVITEALDLTSLEQVAKYTDIIQIGTRNMQNFTLLQEAGKLSMPIMLKRGMSATIEEWLSAADYLMDSGNTNIILCERGLRSFDRNTRNLLDLTAIPVVKKLSHLPVIVDPSHGTGRKDLVLPMSKGAIAVGAHGIIVDVHDRPQEALCDGPQALNFSEFEQLVDILKSLSQVLNLKM